MTNLVKQTVATAAPSSAMEAANHSQNSTMEADTISKNGHTCQKNRGKFFIIACFALLVASFTNIQKSFGQITGTVISRSDGKPLSGVTVIVLGTTQSTITSADGRYRINAPANATLQFSIIGMNSEKIDVNGRQVIDVAMQDSGGGNSRPTTWELGFQGGINFTRMFDTDNVNFWGSQPGFQFGVVFERNHLQTGIFFVKEIVNIDKNEYTINFINVPLNVYITIPPQNRINKNKFLLMVGSYLGYAISGTYKEDGGSNGIVTFGKGDDDLIKAFDFGLNFGLGGQLGNFRGILGVNGSFRSNDIGEYEGLQKNNFFLTLTYLF